VRDTLTILETLADHAPSTKDVELLTEYCRQALSRSITRRFMTPEGIVPLVTLSPKVEKLIAESVQRTETGTMVALEPTTAQHLLSRLAAWVERFTVENHQPVLLCSSTVRSQVRRLTERFLPSLSVISAAELASNVKIHSLGVVTLDE